MLTNRSQKVSQRKRNGLELRLQPLLPKAAAIIPPVGFRPSPTVGVNAPASVTEGVQRAEAELVQKRDDTVSLL